MLLKNTVENFKYLGFHWHIDPPAQDNEYRFGENSEQVMLLTENISVSIPLESS